MINWVLCVDRVDERIGKNKQCSSQITLKSTGMHKVKRSAHD